MADTGSAFLSQIDATEPDGDTRTVSDLDDHQQRMRAATKATFTVDHDPATGRHAKTIQMGDGTDSNMILQAYNGYTNKPQIRYNASTNDWEAAKNDTTTFTSITAAANPTLKVIRTLAASATWSRPGDMTSTSFVVVEVCGGGGGGGGGASSQGAAGGGSGGYSRKRIAYSSLGSTETVTIGAGGAGGSAAGTGSTGGTSSFGSHATATGGVGGGPVTTDAGLGGVGASGDLNTTGNGGGSSDETNGEGGSGGGSFFGGGAPGGQEVAGTAYGGGGSGAKDAHTGGAGFAGVVVVEEWY